MDLANYLRRIGYEDSREPMHAVLADIVLRHACSIPSQLPIDFEAPNFQLVHDPASHFTQLLVVSRAMPRGRHVLRGNELAFHAIGGETQRRAINGSAQLLAVLGELFGIEARDLPQLAVKFDAQATGSAARS